MSTLAIMKNLESAGMDAKQAEVVAEAIESAEKPFVTKEYLDAKLATLHNRIFMEMLTVAGVLLAAIKLL